MWYRDETPWSWARDLVRTARHVRNKRQATDTFVAFFVPAKVLRLQRRIKYGRSR